MCQIIETGTNKDNPGTASKMIKTYTVHLIIPTKITEFIMMRLLTTDMKTTDSVVLTDRTCTIIGVHQKTTLTILI